jgi:hypothetical protein
MKELLNSSDCFRGRLLTLFGVAMLVFVPGPSAEATNAPIAPPGFRLGATNGYTLSVLGLRNPSTHRGTILLAMRSRHGEALYSAPASIGPTSIETDLGALGSIDVDFVSSGESREERSACGGKPVLVDAGRYEGTIEFSGEDGYSQVHGSSARGEARMALSLGCVRDSPTEGIGGHAPGARLTVRGFPRFEFTVIKNSSTRPARFSASIEERRGDLRISRGVRLTAAPDSFHFNSRSGTAHVNPPAPFAGEANYRRSAHKGSRWRGDLRVDFPGQAGVRLTGLGTRPSLVRAVLNPSHPFIAP